MAVYELSKLLPEELRPLPLSLIKINDSRSDIVPNAGEPPPHHLPQSAEPNLSCIAVSGIRVLGVNYSCLKVCVEYCTMLQILSPCL